MILKGHVHPLVERLESVAPGARINMAPAVRDDVSVLAEALQAEDPAVRRDAACVLGILGPAANRALLPLTLALEDEDAAVRRHAERALGRMGPPTFIGVL